ncbi:MULTISPECIES: aromatic acid exporter family protein [unclassified Rathayibacter]|uniref:FUSC family protein n=1 Tax=unclassified Rathayibacter TaxID=2609250 RepID=UPI000CE78088|nr:MULTISPECIES: aromatic acid exporter family protein [unclassified Rathayibacter]PPG48772.1 FUSC family protein [Rathayibacter sp. AY2B3]PPI27105.1 FUSC family protein [Rathayibacter sp. AY1B5]
MPRTRTPRAALAWREAVTGSRLMLALKTALAVGIAWAVAPLAPGVAEQYPYYAPLGALVSMYPTLMGSVRTGLQTLLGLAAGIGLAALVIVTVGPTWWTIPLVVGIGVVLSGTGWFGAGREYVPMAALFVLIIGGADAEDYSLGYLVQMAVGVVVGLLVNVVVAPGLTVEAASARIDAFQRELAEHLRQLAAALEETWPPEHEAWARNGEELARTAEEVRAALAEADESRKGNPRALLHRRDSRPDHLRLETLDAILFHVRDLSGALADTIWERPGALPFDPALGPPLSEACRAVADAIDRDDAGSPAAHRAIGGAARAIRHLVQVVDERTAATSRTLGPGVLAAMHLRRVLVRLQHDGAEPQEG